MRLALPFLMANRPPLQLRRRTLVLLIVVAGHLLLMLVFLRLAPPVGVPKFAGAIQLLPELEDDEKDDSDEAEAEPEITTETVKVDETPPPPPVVVEEPYDLSIIKLTRDEFAAADIARLPKQDRPAAAGGAAPGDSVPVGSGPNGEPLYNAEWQRRPTQAELAFYVPANVPRPGWAVIACQTAERFRVENCQEVGQSHTGYAMASAIREAAWQFRVIPPRKGGKKLIGAWVSIRIDFLEGKDE